MKGPHVYFVIIFSLSWCITFGQNASIRKADKLYEDSRYAEAIHLYESVLDNHPDNALLIKLAHCYRWINKMDKAEQLYAKIVTQDRVPSKQLYYYGEALMSNEKYDEARQIFLKYAQLVPKDTMANRMAENCLKIKYLQALFPSTQVEAFSQNSEVDDHSPVLYGSGLVFSSDRKDKGVKVLKYKSGWTDRDYVNIYYSELDPGTGYSPAKVFSKKLSALNKNTSSASFSKDRKEVFFTRNSFEANKKDVYAMQLLTASSPNGQQWEEVKVLSFCSKEYNYMHPSVTSDGKSLFFASDKPRGHGGTDIYVSRKVGKTWKRPENLGPVINTASNEGFPFAYMDGKLFFCSKGHSGYGGFDIFFSQQDETGKWMTPVNVGKPINSASDDISLFLLPDGQGGFFTSSRDGGDDDIYLFRIDGNAEQIIAGIKNRPSLPPVGDAQPPTETVSATIITPEDDPHVSQMEGQNEFVSTSTADTEYETPSVPVSQEEKKLESPIKESIAETVIPPQENTASNQDSSPVNITSNEGVVEGKKRSEESAQPLQSITRKEEPLELKDNITEAKLPVDKSSENAGIIRKVEKDQQPAPPVSTKTIEKEVLPAEPLLAEKKEYSYSPIDQEEENEDVTRMMIFEEVIVKEQSVPIGASAGSAIIPEESLLVMEEGGVAIDWPGKNQTLPVEYDGAFSGGQPVPIIVPSTSNYFTIKGFEERHTPYTGAASDVGKVFKISGITFGPGEYNIFPALQERLDQLTDILKQHPSIDIEIGSHTESLGDDQANLELSKLRAAVVEHYLQAKGIASNRMSTRGFGETRLLNKCLNNVPCTSTEHQFNQRLEIKVLKF